MAVVSSIWAGLLLATVAYAQGSYYDDLYMQDLYKRLSEVSNLFKKYNTVCQPSGQCQDYRTGIGGILDKKTAQ